MNTDAIFQKYWKALLALDIASEVDSAIALALRLAIQGDCRRQCSTGQRHERHHCQPAGAGACPRNGAGDSAE
jgi:hypothetical protein